MNLRYIYKIIKNEEWIKAKSNRCFSGSSKDIKDGYIHFSGEEQLEETLKKYYPNQTNLILLKIDTLSLDHLLWEQTSDGNFFPHLYSTLEISSVIKEIAITQKNGQNILPNIFKK